MADPVPREMVIDVRLDLDAAPGDCIPPLARLLLALAAREEDVTDTSELEA
jgi:hypothetical protein